MRNSSHLLLLAVCVPGLACSHDSAAPSNTSTPPNIATATFAPSLNVNVAAMTKTADGLYYQDSVSGTGTTAASGHNVTVAYTGWLTNGSQFDANPSFPFTLGVGQVIAGWDEGVAGMKIGGWRKLVIPPSLGYGNQQAGTIPPNSILVFNIQLKAVQ